MEVRKIMKCWEQLSEKQPCPDVVVLTRDGDAHYIIGWIGWWVEDDKKSVWFDGSNNKGVSVKIREIDRIVELPYSAFVKIVEKNIEIFTPLLRYLNNNPKQLAKFLHTESTDSTKNS